MTIEAIKKEECTGCGLCSELCSKRSISMMPDDEGFLRPQINQATCIDCGLCYKKCPVNVDLKRSEEIVYYSGAIKDEKAIMKSSSGGLFHALATVVLNNGGYVCGCIVDERNEAVHVCSNDAKIVAKMMGSKYVQSKFHICLPEVKRILGTRKTVLFTGTACQVAAVRQYTRDDANLITVDILCHGVPSPRYFRSYVDYLEKKYKGHLQKIEFRNKDILGWGAEHRTYIEINQGNKVKAVRPSLPSYFCAFFYGQNLRLSCYQCKYAGTSRVSDLTIGDYWGAWTRYRKYFPKGISVISVNTSMGQQLLEKISEEFEIFDRLDQKSALGSNTNFYHPTELLPERSFFYNRINEKEAYRKTRRNVFFCKSTRKKLMVSLYGKYFPKFLKDLYQSIKYRNLKASEA